MSIVKVAKHAGVSQATVSNVINDSAKVDTKTAARVRKVMKDIGYTPPPLDRRPGRRPKSADGIRTGNVALLWPDSTHGSSIAIGLLQGITQELTKRNLNLSIGFWQSDYGDQPFKNLIQSVDGCLVQGPAQEAPDTLALIKSRPVVWLGSLGPKDWGDRVCTDHGQIARESAAYLRQQNCEKFVFINLQPEHEAFRQRRAIFVDDVQATSGLSPEVIEPSTARQLKKDAHGRAADVAGRLSRVLADGRSTGVFISTDQQASIVDRACRERGLRLTDVATVVSCDRETSALVSMMPKPATFDLMPERLGALAVERLLERLRSPDTPGQVTVLAPVRLIDP